MGRVPEDLSSEILAMPGARRDTLGVHKPRGRYLPESTRREVSLFDPRDPFTAEEGKQWGTRGYDPTVDFREPGGGFTTTGVNTQEFWHLLGALQRTWEYAGLMNEFADEPLTYLVRQMRPRKGPDVSAAHVANLLNALLDSPAGIGLGTGALAALPGGATVADLSAALTMTPAEVGSGEAYRVVFFLIHHLHQCYVPDSICK